MGNHFRNISTKIFKIFCFNKNLAKYSQEFSLVIPDISLSDIPAYLNSPLKLPRACLNQCVRVSYEGFSSDLMLQ